MPQKPAPTPEGYTTVTPWIIVHGAAGFIEFLERVLDAEEIGRVNGPDGSIQHAEVRIGTAIVMVFDTREGWPEVHQCLRLYVEDAPALLERALSAGGRLVTRVTELGFGDRVGRFADPWGNLWWLQERLEALTPEEMGRRMAQPDYAAAMAHLQESLEEEMRRRRG